MRLLCSCLLVLLSLRGQDAGAQNNTVFNLKEGDSVLVQVSARGEIQWERSTDNLSWADLPGETSSRLTIRAERGSWYRARITEKNCDPIYSSHTRLRVIPEEPRDNIIFILADDLGWMDLGCYGSDYYETPNLDRLARGGVRFTDAYSAHPVCSPTRSSIVTGQRQGTSQ